MNIILSCILIFAAGVAVGYLLKEWLYHRANYSGTIFVTEHEHKTLYSLELTDYPEAIQFKKEVVFKVDAPKKSSNRE